jgi:hypothetical protein
MAHVSTICDDYVAETWREFVVFDVANCGRTDVFNAAHLEGKNVVEVLQKCSDSNVKANMSAWLEEWSQRLLCAADCANLSELLMEVEGRITDSLTRKSGKKNAQKGNSVNGASAPDGADGHGGGNVGEAAHADKGDADNGDANADPDATWLQDDSEYGFVGKKVRRGHRCSLRRIACCAEP